MPDVAGDYIIAAGSKAGAWRLKVTPNLGTLTADGFPEEGEPIIDLRDQTTRPTPLEWLAGLMSGGAA